jgi:hypothetical protein
VPYIPEDERPEIAITLPPGLGTGQLNFLVSDIIDQWIGLVPNYDRLNSAIGVLECCLQEVYRKVVVPFESKKETKNGPVFMERE